MPHGSDDAAVATPHAPSGPDGVVTTVTGTRRADELGIVLPCEHLLSDFTTPVDTEDGWAGIGRTRPEGATERAFYEAPLTMARLGEVGMGRPNRDAQRLDDVDLAVRELEPFAAHGTTTLIEATTRGRGRDPRGLRRIAEASGVAVVMGAGWYHPAWDESVRERTPENLADEIVAELTDGVDGVRAGLIGRLGALNPTDASERALLVAAAQASARTQAAILLDRATDPDAQAAVLDLLAAEGADLSRVAVGGCDGLAPHPDRLAAVLEAGAFVLFSRLGRLPTVLSDHDDQDVARALLELAGHGYSTQLLLSQGNDAKDTLLAYGGGGYAFVLQQFIPLLMMFGGDSELVEQITSANPRRLLSMPEAQT